jgi:hypothetical protein
MRSTRCRNGAERDGLVPAIGQDAAQELLATAFVHQRDDLPRDADVSEPIADEADDEYDGLSPTFAAACRAADEKQFRKPRDPRIERLRRLMANDVSLDRAWHELSDRPPGDVPIATLRAAEYLLPLGDLERWKKMVRRTQRA